MSNCSGSIPKRNPQSDVPLITLSGEPDNGGEAKALGIRSFDVLQTANGISLERASDEHDSEYLHLDFYGR